MWNDIRVWAVCAAVVVVMDMGRLYLLSASFHRSKLSDLEKTVDSPVPIVLMLSVLLYFLLVFGLARHVVPRILGAPASVSGFREGALFGMMLFFVYDLTIGMIMKLWSLQLAVAESLWGGLICGTAALIATSVERISLSI